MRVYRGERPAGGQPRGLPLHDAGCRWERRRGGPFGRPGLAALVVALAVVPAAIAAGPSSTDDQLWHHRNLGKAFYENPTTQYEAVAELKAALDLAPGSARERVNYALALLKAGKAEEGIAELERAQKQDPSIPHTWFNLGIAFKRASRYAEALAQLEGMAQRVPDEAITQYNLGVLYNLEGRTEQALAAFERTARLDPNLAGPHFQLATAYRKAGRAADAQKSMATFREIKQRTAGAAVPEDLEWSFYSEIYETIEPGQSAPPPAVAQLQLTRRKLASGLDAGTAGLLVLDADGDRKPDLLAYSAAGVKLYKAGTAEAPAGLEGVTGGVGAAAGDLDNDGLPEICLLTKSGARLFANRAGKLAPHAAALPAGVFDAALFLDYDRDYDLDLFLFGAASVLLRNNGDGTFADRTASFPFKQGRAVAAAGLDVVPDTQGLDIAVGYEDGSAVLYRDRLSGRYEAVPLAGSSFKRGPIVAYDADNDGWTDLFAAAKTGVTFLRNDHRGGFRAAAVAGAPAGPFVVADLENRGAGDLAAVGLVLAGDGRGGFAAGRAAAGLAGAVALAAEDFDGDGRTDLAAVDPQGNLSLLTNATPGANRFLRVGLEGVKNLKLAPGSEVEVKAGARYQKKLYEGRPLLFGLAGAAEVDAVRITWPNGLIQNETKQAAGGSPSYKEAQRLSGSCPMIFTWNGRELEFITDVLGVAPLGASAGDGQYFPVDHDEYVQIAGESLVARDGAYEIRITEELREVAFLDQVRLVAIDHPAEVEIFTNDKFKGPPFPEFRLFGVSRRLPPVAARDHRGRDVTERLLARDRTYPDSFARDYAGVAELNWLELDFGPAAAAENRAVLVLSGWVDWADGSTFLGAAQAAGGGLVMPYLQVKDAAGEWRTVIEDLGLPAGKPKTIAVDLTDKFLSASREVRIVTNLCVYWDEIFLSAEPGAPRVALAELPPRTADLHFRGFSRVEIHPERKQPERFVYAEKRPLSMWNPTPGLYTRYGPVGELLAEVDDHLVILGSGDEIRLLFDAAALPPLPEGWRRDFLLKVDGWAKDADANTAHGQSVEPLPYHGMPQYPYEAPHAFPDDPAHRLYREHYNTRPALRFIRPLVEEGELVREAAGNRPPG